MAPDLHLTIHPMLVDAAIILAGVLLSLVVGWRWRARSGRREWAALALGVAAIAVAGTRVVPALSTLSALHQSSESPAADRDYCAVEDHAGGVIPYIRWIERRVPPRAVYSSVFALNPVAVGNGQPDLWCVTEMLLPRLPAAPGERAGWTVTFGTVPDSIRTLISEHSPRALVYRPSEVVVGPAAGTRR